MKDVTDLLADVDRLEAENAALKDGFKASLVALKDAIRDEYEWLRELYNGVFVDPHKLPEGIAIGAISMVRDWVKKRLAVLEEKGVNR